MLNNRKIFNYYLLMLATYVAMNLVTQGVAYNSNPINPIYTRDFANYWIAAKIIFEGDILSIFNQSDYIVHLKKEFGSQYPWHNWSYPPSFLLFIAPLYLFPYLVALPVFLLSTFALFFLGAKAFSREHNSRYLQTLSPWKTPVFAWLVIAPILSNILYTQNGFLTSGLMLLGLALRYKKPFLAGICIGLLTIKPQLGILIPFLLLFERNWTAIFSACLTSMFLVIASITIFGFEAWQNYIEITVPYQSLIMTTYGGGTEYLAMMLSGFIGARNIGIEGAYSWALHSAFAIPALLLTFIVFYKSKDTQKRATTLVIATFIITPYAFNYDAGVLSVICALYGLRTNAQCGEAIQNNNENKAAFLRLRTKLFYIAAALPVLAHTLGLLFISPISPFILLACLILMTPQAEGYFLKWLDAKKA